jgi:thymidylate synthase
MSWDVFLGGPFNIASYSLLTLMIAQVCGLRPSELVISVTDGHLYLNHLDQVQEQLNREITSAPTVTLNPDIDDITKFTMNDIELHDYDPQSAIKANMAV